MVPSGFITPTQIDNEVSRAVLKLGPKVVRVRHSVGEDWDGDPAIYFRIVLTDEASREENLAKVAGHVTRVLFERTSDLAWM